MDNVLELETQSTRISDANNQTNTIQRGVTKDRAKCTQTFFCTDCLKARAKKRTLEMQQKSELNLEGNESGQHRYAPRNRLVCSKICSSLFILILAGVSLIPYCKAFAGFGEDSKNVVVKNKIPIALRIVLIIFGIYFVIQVLFHFFDTTTRDPGYVSYEKFVDKPIIYRECKKCQRPKPFRAHHSATTGACVARFDHYCPVVSSDIGYGNQGSFIIFLAFAFSGLLFSLVSSVIFTGLQGFENSPLFLVSAVLCLVFAAAVAGILFQQIMLVNKGATSVEYQEYLDSENYKNGEKFIGRWSKGSKKENRKELIPNIGLMFIPFIRNKPKCDGYYPIDPNTGKDLRIKPEAEEPDSDEPKILNITDAEDSELTNENHSENNQIFDNSTKDETNKDLETNKITDLRD